MAYTIEVISVGADLYGDIEPAIERLNAAQSEFIFSLPPERLRNHGIPLKRREYQTNELWERLREYRKTAKGHRPFLICALNASLRSDRLKGIFGSHEANEGLAAFTLVDQARYVQSRSVFICYFLIRYCLSFVAPDLKSHQDTRSCFFDKKLYKRDLLQSLTTGDLCDDCRRAMEQYLSYEASSAIDCMIGALKDTLAEDHKRAPAALAEQSAQSNAQQQFDVFLSYNRESSAEVLKVALALRKRGLRVWFDQWELIPGRQWQDALEDAIGTVACAAVFIGKEGIGPWQTQEKNACVDQFVKRGLPVIPVILPNVKGEPKLPLLLNGFTWVDLRIKPAEFALEQLECGIRGEKPGTRNPSA